MSADWAFPAYDLSVSAHVRGETFTITLKNCTAPNPDLRKALAALSQVISDSGVCTGSSND